LLALKNARKKYIRPAFLAVTERGEAMERRFNGFGFRGLGRKLLKVVENSLRLLKSFVIFLLLNTFAAIRIEFL
jgi:hypothetical protein